MIKDKDTILQDEEYINIVKDIIENEKVQQMKQYRQHYEVNCFDHCLYVSYISYLICKKYHLDYISVARAAMVHDMFLYDWRKREDGRKGHHAFSHPKKALEIASSIFDFNDKEKDIILKHMWPVTLAFPKYKESFIVSLVDKYCAVHEAFIKNQDKEKEIIIK